MALDADPGEVLGAVWTTPLSSGNLNQEYLQDRQHGLGVGMAWFLRINLLASSMWEDLGGMQCLYV